MNAKDIMTIHPVTVSPSHGIRHAITIMLERQISGLPVVDDEGRVVGMLTEGDLLGRSELGSDALVEADLMPGSAPDALLFVKAIGWSVGDVMSRSPVVIEETTPVSEIAARMARHSIKRLPVLRGGRLVGVVSRADLLRVIMETATDDTAIGDRAIALCMSTRLRERSDVVGQGIEADVSDGIVRLSGFVPSDNAARAARAIAETIRGVNGVDVQLTVRNAI